MKRSTSYLVAMLFVGLFGCADEPQATNNGSGNQQTTPTSDMSGGDVEDMRRLDMGGDEPDPGDMKPADGGQDMKATPGGDMSTPSPDMREDTPDDQSPCAPLGPPTGSVVMVTPAQADMLPEIVASATTGTTILLEDGVYKSTRTGEGSRRLQFKTAGVTLRSASGNPEAVILDAEYDTNELISVSADNVTIAEVTLTHARDHIIHVTGSGAETIEGFSMHRVRLIDGGEQFVKINATSQDGYADFGEVTCSYFELTDAGRPEIERNPGGCYTGGIDAHAARGWRVAHNTFDGIYCAGEGLAEHAVHFWRSSRDTIVEYNHIFDCARGVGFGLGGPLNKRAYEDDPYPGVTDIEHYDGVIRNNIIFNEIAFYDTGIELQHARGARVLHNTIMSTESATGFFSSIDSRFENTRSEITNNIARRITTRGNAQPVEEGNIVGQDTSMFVNPAARDLHLLPGAAAIDAGVVVEGAGVDIDGQARDGAPDVGADEVVD